MDRRTFFVAVFVLVVVVGVQVAWHIALDWDNWVSRDLLDIYLSGNRKPVKPTSFVFDVIIPGIIAGYLFGAFTRTRSYYVQGTFSVLMGVALNSVPHFCQRYVRYEFWWLPADRGVNMAFHAGIAALCCLMPILGYNERRSGETAGRRDGFSSDRGRTGRE